MKRTYFDAVALLLAVPLLWMLAGTDAHAARTLDSLTILQTPSGAYITCFDFNVMNRQQDSSLRISDFRLRIISGRATFMPGFTESPPSWSVLSQSATSLRWTSNGAAADITVGRTVFGYHFCIADTGVFRVVWETRNLDSVISSDTLAFAGRHPDCDEAFPRLQPSLSRSIADVDIVIGNSSGRLVNDIRFHPITPGVTLSTALLPMPAGWVRLHVRPDTIGYFTNTNALDFNQFAEGFRLELFGAAPDSLVEVEWMTLNFGDILCRDTLRLRFGLARRDSLARIGVMTPTPRGVRADFVLRNTHLPASLIDKVTMKLLPAGVRVDSLPVLPPGWTVSSVGADSLVISIPGGMQPGDTALLSRFAFDNVNAASDSIRVRWYTYVSGIDITPGQIILFALRPLLSCDSVTATVDSTVPAPSRCISLMVKNRNSRRDQIKGFTVHISNPGKARTVISAAAPAPWRVAASGGDSVIFTSGTTVAGATAGPFTICTSLGDASTKDPLSIAWTTLHVPGPACGDTLRVSAIIAVVTDSVRVHPMVPADTAESCFQLRLVNRNAKGRPLDRFHLEVGQTQGVIINSASASLPWHVSTTTFPGFEVDFDGDAIAPGETSPLMNICFDAHLLTNRPVTIPAVWRSFSAGVQVSVDTVRLVFDTPSNFQCDAVDVMEHHVQPVNQCYLRYRLTNLHVPASTVDGIRLSIVPPRNPGQTLTASLEGNAAAWQIIEQSDTSVLVRGPAVPTGDTLGSVVLTISGADMPFTLEECTLDGGFEICCAQHPYTCGDAAVESTGGPDGFAILAFMPNPVSHKAVLRYEMKRSATVAISITDQLGAVRRRIAVGRRDAGTVETLVDLDGLPAGEYYCTIDAGGERDTRRIVVTR